jgi:glycosyltransferase involved in cell wall biosynthesis
MTPNKFGKTNPRLLYLCGSLKAGGTERHLSQILPALKQRGWPITVLRLGADGPMSAPIHDAGIEIVAADVKPLIPLPKIGGLSALLSQVNICRRVKRAEHPVILHSFLGAPSLIAATATLFDNHTRLVVSKRNQLRNPEMFAGERSGEAWAMRRADAVMAHSSEVRREILTLGIRPNRLHLVHNGINLKPYRDAQENRAMLRKQFGWTGKTILVSLANLIPYKGHSFLLDGLTQFSSKTPAPANWRCVLVGHGEAGFEQKLRRSVREKQLEDQIEFMGYRSDIADILAAADIGVLLSDHEGFSNAILEYMAAGLPVIATSVGGNLDSVTAGQTGFLVNPKDVSAFSTAMQTLVSDQDRRTLMGQAGFEIVRDKFSIDACLKGYESVYRSLLELQ